MNNQTTNFYNNIYTQIGGEHAVAPTPYLRSDIKNEKNLFERVEPCLYKKSKNPNVGGRWGWGYYSNGYGYGNFHGHKNSFFEDDEPKGYVSAKTKAVIDAHAGRCGCKQCGDF